MRSYLLLTAMLCFGCSNDPEIAVPPQNMTSVGSVYRFDATYLDSSFTRTDSVTEGPASRNGKPYVIRIGEDDKFHPTLYAYESNGNISRYHSLMREWLTMRFGTRESSRWRDSTFRGNDWIINETTTEYRDTVLEIDGQIYSGVKEERNWSYNYFDLRGSSIDSLNSTGIEYDVWIPAIGYYGLIVSDPEHPLGYIARLRSFRLGATPIK